MLQSRYLTNINDLPNEILDEIFAYVNPTCGRYRMTPISTVSQRWNRPSMTQILARGVPAHIDLQTKFPKLTSFELLPDAKFFKGHAFLRQLLCVHVSLVSSVLNCPRLTSLTLGISPGLFFKDDNLEVFLALLPRLEILDIYVSSDKDLTAELKQSYNQKLATILQRPKPRKLKLKRLFASIYQVDFISFCQLFQTSSLAHFETFNNWKTPEHVRKIVELFPKICSLGARGCSILSLTGISFDHITTLRLELNIAKPLSFSSLMSQFPNVESLEVRNCQIVFDLEYPTRLTCLKMTFTGVVQPRLLCHLKTLDWTTEQNLFNYLMQELGKHCPNLESITIYQKTDSIVPKLDNIVFPLLATLVLSTRVVEFNSSLFRFLTRHGQLKSLDFHAIVKIEGHWIPFAESNQILWPNLRDLKCIWVDGTNVDYKRQIRDCFVRNAPNLMNYRIAFGCFG